MIRVTDFIDLAPIVQRVDKTIQRINHYTVDSLDCFANTYHWTVIYSVDSVILPLSNRDQE